MIKITGLVPGKEYKDTNELHYGLFMVMTDQDHDGSHIKGLLFNFVHHFWSSLLQASVGWCTLVQPRVY